MKRLFALRGATQCENTQDDMCKQIGNMYDEILVSNKLKEDDIVSVMFSVTSDLNIINPCTALRLSGRANTDTVLFSSQEPEFNDSLEKVVRVIIHCYLEKDSKIKHVYRNGTGVLRPDWSKE